MSSFFVVYMNLTLVMNDNYLYILCQWHDNTTRPNLGGNNYDGIYFCWNIDVANFSAYFIDGMVTANMGGGDVDNWDWTCLSTSPSNGSSYFCRDMAFGTTGWYDPNLEIDHVRIGYSYVENKSYLPEEQTWIFSTENPQDMYSRITSNVLRLPNGNTLICDSNQGHILEVTNDKNVIWDFFNPYPTFFFNKNVARIQWYSPEYLGLKFLK